MVDERTIGIRYNLPRTYVKVSGLVTERWNWELEQVVSEAKDVQIALATAADSIRRALLEVPESRWADTAAKLMFTPDGMLEGLDYASTGKRAETFKTLFTGIANGIVAVAPAKGATAGESGGAQGDGGDGDGGDKPAEEPAAAKSAADKPAAGQPPAGSDAAKKPDVVTAPPEEPAADEPPASGSAAAPKEPEVPKVPEAPDDRPEGNKQQRAGRARRYEDDFPENAKLRSEIRTTATELQRRLLRLIAAPMDKKTSDTDAFTASFNAMKERMDAITPLAKAFDEHFDSWRRENEPEVTVEVSFDLDIWDLPFDAGDAKWKTAVGRTRIREELAAALEYAGSKWSAWTDNTKDRMPEVLESNQRVANRVFYMSRDRRVTQDAILAAFDRFGIVISFRHLFRDGEDRDDDAGTSDLREVDAAGGTDALIFRHPRRVDFRVYRVSGPVGREVLSMQALRHEAVVDEASSNEQIPLRAGVDATKSLTVETHPGGTVKSLSIATESERAAAFTAIGEGIEAYAKAIAVAVPVVAATAAPGVGALAKGFETLSLSGRVSDGGIHIADMSTSDDGEWQDAVRSLFPRDGSYRSMTPLAEYPD